MFELRIYDEQGRVASLPAETLQALALQLNRMLCGGRFYYRGSTPCQVREWSIWVPYTSRLSRVVACEAVSLPREAVLRMPDLLAYGERLAREARWRYKPSGFRGSGPVPRTGRSWRKYSRIFRHPQTQQARRQACVRDPDEPMPRGRRGMRALPSSWDDQIIRTEKSWKRQYRGVKAWDRCRRR